MSRRDRDVDGEKASEVDDGIPTNRETSREYRDSQKTQRRSRAHAGGREGIREIECQSDARDDHDPNQGERAPIRVARLAGFGALLERKTQLREHIDESEHRGDRLSHGRSLGHADANNFSSGPRSSSRIIPSNLSPIFSRTAIEPRFSGDVMATMRGNRNTRLAWAKTADAASAAYPFAQCRDRNANPTSASVRPSRLTNPQIPIGVPSSRQAAYKPKPCRP